MCVCVCGERKIRFRMKSKVRRKQKTVWKIKQMFHNTNSIIRLYNCTKM